MLRISLTGDVTAAALLDHLAELSDDPGHPWMVTSAGIEEEPQTLILTFIRG